MVYGRQPKAAALVSSVRRVRQSEHPVIVSARYFSQGGADRVARTSASAADLVISFDPHEQ